MKSLGLALLLALTAVAAFMAEAEPPRPRTEIENVHRGQFEWRLKWAVREIWEQAREQWPACERIAAVVFPKESDVRTWVVEGFCIDQAWNWRDSRGEEGKR